MSEQKKNPKETNEESPGERRLLRSSRERMLWGVAGGLAEYLRIDPTLVRLGFVVAAFFGGFGVLAYLVMAVVVPQNDGSGRPLSGRRPPTVAIVLLVVAVLIALPGPFWGWDHGWWWGFAGPLWIGVLILAGILAYRAITGRPLWRSLGARSPRAQTSEGGGEADTGDAEQESAPGPRIVRGIVLAILILAALCAACCIAAIAGWMTATGSGAVVAGIVIALGLALAATAFLADARRASPWLLAAALLLALPAGAVAAADVRFDGGIGERDYRPASIADLPDDGYELGVGQLTVDLRDLPWAAGQTIPLESDLGVGQMIVSVPSNVCVDAHATAKAGELIVRGESSDGVDTELDNSEPVGTAPRLDLDAELQLGQLVVTDRDPDEVDNRDFHDGNDLDDESQAETCGRAPEAKP
jgi:phage shock protein PspC (stress-responsive transcriptional regulator)